MDNVLDPFEAAGFNPEECKQLRELSEKYDIEPERLIAVINQFIELPN